MYDNDYTDMFDQAFSEMSPRDQLHELVDALDDDLIADATAALLEIMGK